MKLLKHAFFLISVLFVLLPNVSRAEHVIGGDIYWECLNTGPDAGKFVFYLKLYRDCSVQNTIIDSQGHFLTIDNHPDFAGASITLNLISETDITTGSCGVPCGQAGANDISITEYLFSTDPIQINGVPPANGFVIKYFRCCRTNALNLVQPQFEEIRYAATMYPFNGQSTFPCYDSSPQFSEKPTSVLCSGYELRYNSDAVDSDLDSLSYQFIQPAGTGGDLIPYQAGYSLNSPLPGPALNPGYDLVSLDPVTGQLEYDSPSTEQGNWSVAIAVFGWRCGQLVSQTVREMTVSLIACTNPNNVPQVVAPNWTAPASGSGFAVTVNAGDLVSFDITGTDADAGQVLEFTASGSQFGSNFTNANSGCTNAPCATLSNVVPPITTGNGSIGTTFNWQTDCNHVGIYDDCGNLTNTYNFLFKYQDDYCPASGSNIVNVAVTVLGEAIVPSPDPHCASTDANGNITLSWETVTDNSNPPSFEEYIIYHSTSASGPYTEIGTVTDINTGTYTHNVGGANPPTTSGPNFYVIRTRSGCNDQVITAPVDTISSIYLTMSEDGTTVDLNWTPVATPPLASSNGNGQGLYQVYREYPIGTWNVIGTTFGLAYEDPIVWCNEQVNYRVELTDNLPCTSVSNIVGDILTSSEQPAPQPIDSVVVDPVTGFITVCWPPNPSPNVVEYHILLNPNQFAWLPMDTVYGYNSTCWTDMVTDASSQSLWYQVFAVNNCDIPGVPSGSIADGTDHHETIFLQADYDSCTVATTLNWTAYWYWPQGIEYYDIYVSENSGNYTKIGTTADTTFYHDNLQASAEYCYFVRAKQNGSNVTATSNGRCILANVPKRPDYGYNYNTTVQPGNTGVEEYFFSDSVAGYLGFEIQRGTEPDNLNYLWFVPFDPNTRFYEYVDAGAQPQNTSYYYQVIGVDSCDNYADTLNMSRTIYLEAEANSDRTNSLQWNPYEGWNGGVTAYNIYRSYEGPFQYYRTVPPNQLTFLDSIEEIIIG
ncbi:MAG: hypothetical protein KDB98_03365, partial [Flavobacteriales bacterium]|nr:hypothetical protein [Flavobacteriales bacterium]